MQEMSLDFIDGVRAYFHAKAGRNAYVDLPWEDYPEEICGKLKKAMYGTRDAAPSWELRYTETTVEAGLTQGSYSSRVVRQGEEYSGGCARSLTLWVSCIYAKFKSRLQRRRLGSVRILSRIVTVASGGVEYEADQRHAEI